EAQAKLVAEYLIGGYDLPERTARRQQTERERAQMFARYVTSRRHTMQLDYDVYLAQLKAETETGRRRAQHRAGRAGFGLPEAS
ncbi:MAG: NAD(P)/FAD-dependent oxidoreductase, partial [Polyangiaceae bacterium]